MVKFSKQFEGQLIPHWKGSFVDYFHIKKDFKRIHLENSQKNQPNANDCSNTIFSSLANFMVFGRKNRDHEAIHVHKKLASSASFGDLYETELLAQLLVDCEAAKEFFSFLDFRLNKVNQFYWMKEKEFLDRGKTLKQQADILVGLKLRQPRVSGGTRERSNKDSKEDISISSIFSSEGDSVKYSTEQDQLQESNKAAEETHESEMPFAEFPKVEELGNSKRMTMKRQDSVSRSKNGRSFRCQGKNLKLHS